MNAKTLKAVAVMLSIAIIIGGFAAGGAFSGLGEPILRGIAAARAPTPAPAPAPRPAAPAPATVTAKATPPSPPPAPATQAGVPTGYVLEDCQQGTGATGKTIYFRPRTQSERIGPVFFACVHPFGVDPHFLGGTGGEIAQDMARLGGYCAFSKVDLNVGCALTPITSWDLMEPSSAPAPK